MEESLFASCKLFICVCLRLENSAWSDSQSEHFYSMGLIRTTHVCEFFTCVSLFPSWPVPPTPPPFLECLSSHRFDIRQCGGLTPTWWWLRESGSSRTGGCDKGTRGGSAHTAGPAVTRAGYAHAQIRCTQTDWAEENREKQKVKLVSKHDKRQFTACSSLLLLESKVQQSCVKTMCHTGVFFQTHIRVVKLC